MSVPLAKYEYLDRVRQRRVQEYIRKHGYATEDEIRQLNNLPIGIEQMWVKSMLEKTPNASGDETKEMLSGSLELVQGELWKISAKIDEMYRLSGFSTDEAVSLLAFESEDIESARLRFRTFDVRSIQLVTAVGLHEMVKSKGITTIDDFDRLVLTYVVDGMSSKPIQPLDQHSQYMARFVEATMPIFDYCSNISFIMWYDIQYMRPVLDVIFGNKRVHASKKLKAMRYIVDMNDFVRRGLMEAPVTKLIVHYESNMEYIIQSGSTTWIKDTRITDEFLLLRIMLNAPKSVQLHIWYHLWSILPADDTEHLLSWINEITHDQHFIEHFDVIRRLLEEPREYLLGRIRAEISVLVEKMAEDRSLDLSAFFDINENVSVILSIYRADRKRFRKWYYLLMEFIEPGQLFHFNRHFTRWPSKHKRFVQEQDQEQRRLYAFILGGRGSVYVDIMNELSGLNMPKVLAREIIQLNYSPSHPASKLEFNKMIDIVLDQHYGTTPRRPVQAPRTTRPRTPDSDEDSRETQRLRAAPEAYEVLDMEIWEDAMRDVE